MSKNNQSFFLSTLFSRKGLDDLLIILKKRPIYLLVLFLLTTLFFYFPTMQAGFVTDVTGGIERIENQPFWRVIYSFGFPALNQISVLGFYTLYQLFGTFGLPWYLVFCGLHALNGWLSFLLFKNIFDQFEVKNASSIAFVGALLFLINPYQTEVLVWRACLNYLLITAFLLGTLLNLTHYLKVPQKSYLYFIHGFFLAALFTFELSLIIPLIVIVLYSLWLWQSKQLQLFKSHFYKITLPQLLAVVGYFSLNKLAFGAYIGHYGATTHLQFSLKVMVQTWLKYIAKYLFFVRSYPHSTKEIAFNFCDKYVFLLVGLIIGASLLFLFYKKQNNAFDKNKGATFSFLSIGFTLTFLPVLNLFFYWLQWVENDRYGYLPSVFGLMLLTYLLFLLPKILKYSLLGVYLFSSIFLLVQTNQHWKNSTEVFYSLLQNYRWQDAENVIILNVPDNYNGAYLFRIIGRKSGFKDALTTIHQQKIKGKIWEVAQYNMVTPTDGVTVKKTGDQQLKVEFNQWGNWFWRNGVGVGPTHKRSIYTAHFQGNHYLLDLKNVPPNTIFIYQDGMQWKEFFW